VKFLLEKSVEHLEAASRARAGANAAAARYHYLKSAEFLFKAAAKSSGRMREVRLARAQELLDLARGPAGARAEPAADDAEPGAKRFLMRERPDVGFDDVAGLDEAKEEIRLRLIYPLAHPEKARRYGVGRGGGILLFGPPGTGKTLLARAVAGEIDAPFFTAKPSEIMSKWVGEAEQNMQRLFDEARSCGRAVIFLDEVEAMIPARRSSRSTVMQRLVPQVLAELQGVRSRSGTLLFLGATNEPWAIDPAALRPGRFDTKVYVPLPDFPARRRMLEICLSGRPLAPTVDLDELALGLEGYSGADIAWLCHRCACCVFVESIRSGRDRDIDIQDVLAARQQVAGSVSADEELRYRRWAEGPRRCLANAGTAR